MKKAAAHSATSVNNPGTSQVVKTIHISEFVGIGWRIVLPVVAFVALGVVCDARFGTKPWLTLSGLVVGFLLAAWLVRHQFGDAEAADKKSQS